MLRSDRREIGCIPAAILEERTRTEENGTTPARNRELVRQAWLSTVRRRGRPGAVVRGRRSTLGSGRNIYAGRRCQYRRVQFIPQMRVCRSLLGPDMHQTRLGRRSLR